MLMDWWWSNLAPYLGAYLHMLCVFSHSEKGNRNALSWSERLAAAIGAGRGIHHLHTCVVPPVFDNNLKSTNILLGESMDAQVSDYGILGHLSSFAVNVSSLSHCFPPFAVIVQQ